MGNTLEFFLKEVVSSLLNTFQWLVFGKSLNNTKQEHIQIFIKDNVTSETLTLDVDSSDTVQSIKEKIHNVWDLEPELQKINFNMRVLDDDRSLSYYEIQDNFTLNWESKLPNFLPLKKILIYVQNADLLLPLHVHPDDRIQTVRELIAEEWECSSSQYELFFEGQKVSPEEKLSILGIEDESYLIFQKKIWIHIHDAYSYLPLYVYPGDRIRTVRQLFEEEWECSSSQYDLFFEGKKLSPQENLSSYGIGNYSTLKLLFTYRKMININFLGSEPLPLWVSLDDTIGQIKQLIEEKRELPAEWQRLLYWKNEREDFQTLSEIGVRNDPNLFCTVLPVFDGLI